MPKKNLYLVQPNFGIGEGKYAGYWIPYSIGTLWTYCKQFKDISEQYEMCGLLFKRDDIPMLVKSLNDPSIIAFSNYIWNWNYNRTLAKAVKNAFPKALIVFGGPQITNRSQNFFKENPFVDIMVHAEGEETFVEILRENLNEDADFRKINGCSIRLEDCSALKTDLRPRLEIENHPSPYAEGVFDQIIKENPGIVWNTTLETNRGCPFQCTFCDWGSVTYSKIKKFNMKRVCSDLDWISENKVSYVFIADANFGIFMDRDNEILNHAIALKKKKNYPEVLNATWYKNSNEEVVALAKKLTDANLNRAITLSVQSMSFDTLGAIKRKNLAFSKLNELLKICIEKDIPSYTELILGLPEETFESWSNGLTQLLELGQHSTLEIWMCEILENAELNTPESIEKHKIKTMPVSNYFIMTSGENREVEEKIDIIYETSSMPHKDLIRSYMYSWMILNLHSYGWTQFISRFIRKYNNLSYKKFYDSLLEYILTQKNTLLHEELTYSEQVIEACFSPDYKEVEDRYTGIKINLKNALWKSQFAFHSHPEKLFSEISNFIRSLKLDIEPDLFEELIEFQKDFVSHFQKSYPYKKSYNYLFSDFIKHDGDLVKENVVYSFDVVEPFKDKKDYLSMLYYRRRQGWGKTIYKRVDDIKYKYLPLISV